MLYKIEAEFLKEKAKDFLEKLTDGSIASQEPDGSEIVAAMKRATMAKDETIHWTETCYCNTPLAHERETVYDTYFSSMQIQPIDKHSVIPGVSFMEYLRNTKHA